MADTITINYHAKHETPVIIDHVGLSYQVLHIGKPGQGIDIFADDEVLENIATAIRHHLLNVEADRVADDSYFEPYCEHDRPNLRLQHCDFCESKYADA